MIRLSLARASLVLALGFVLSSTAPAQTEIAPLPASVAVLGSDADSCQADHEGAAMLVTVAGLKDRRGQVRLELYADNDEDFLAGAKKLKTAGKTFRRIDVPTPAKGNPRICIALPGPGRYTMAVLHDRDQDGKLDVFDDGYGFPGNPRLGWSKPKARQARFEAKPGVGSLHVVLNYWTGSAAQPIKK